LLAKSAVIRTGLVNASLLPYRYLSTTADNNHIRAMYSNVFDLPEPLTQVLQSSYNHLMSPFLYKGARADIDKATKLYAQFFDAPIQKAEQQAIQHALQSTYNRDEAQAGLLNINQEKVWLKTQQVTVTEHSDWADVELYEMYQNRTPEQQEVFYSFSLPESAVITGLWLGNTSNRAERYPFSVSPRGAAQQVYNQEVAQQVDPALVEQVGPRHYRLRAFPVPPQGLQPQGGVLQEPQLHLWLTYQVMRQKGGWPLPQLGEKRNVFWTQDTQRSRNGQAIAPQNEDWFEPLLSAAEPYQPALHQVDLPGGYRISAKPLSQQDYALAQGNRFALILDTSRSMATHRKQLSQIFANLTGGSNDIDGYVTTSPGVLPQRIDDIRRLHPAKLTFYGTIQLKDMLRQFDTLRGSTSYDAVLLVTDEGTYELSDNSTHLPSAPAPLWMVHLGKLPPAYDDATLKVIQDSSGGVGTEVPEVLQRLATQAARRPVISVVDGYAWSHASGPSTAEPAAQTGFEPMAARQLVLSLSQALGTNQLEQLDTLHTIAQRFEIVTPYSSMIVLVNDRQKEALQKATAMRDRYHREVESGQEQLSQPSDPLTVSGVPEPE
ncbi:MAG TPA: TIGR02921 family PEP-CTERM protein, partial [Candidatus Caenarcaniphilales bacterium]